MDIIDLISAKVNENIRKNLEKSAILSIGELIALLKAVPQAAKISFTNGNIPYRLTSYSRYYDQLAIDYVYPEILPEKLNDLAINTTADLITELQKAIQPGNTFQGYNRGEFQMTRFTPVWKAMWGSSESTGVTGVLYSEIADTVYILTEYIYNGDKE